jgi:hypothetical protein
MTMHHLTYDQIKSDRARMAEFICERIPPNGMRLDMGGGAWADLIPTWDDRFGWDLLLETDEPEVVNLWEVYQHFRRQELTNWEWWAEFEVEMARSKVHSLEREVAVLRNREQDQVAGPQDYAATVDANGLPKEVSTGEAARILGVSKDTVLKLKEAGLLEYRTAGPPDNSRAVYRFRLASVMEFRTSYQADVPIPQTPLQPRRRQVRERQQVFKHLRLE